MIDLTHFPFDSIDETGANRFVLMNYVNEDALLGKSGLWAKLFAENFQKNVQILSKINFVGP